MRTDHFYDGNAAELRDLLTHHTMTGTDIRNQKGEILVGARINGCPGVNHTLTLYFAAERNDTTGTKPRY